MHQADVLPSKLKKRIDKSNQIGYRFFKIYEMVLEIFPSGRQLDFAWQEIRDDARKNLPMPHVRDIPEPPSVVMRASHRRCVRAVHGNNCHNLVPP